MSLRILITNHRWNDLTGAELYVRDLALELRRQGELPAVYTSSCGKVAEELRSEGIPVADSLRKLEIPDIIHGHHRYETLAAVTHFRNTPAIYVCHHHDYWVDIPPKHPSILQYCGVSRLCVERLRTLGIPNDRIRQVFNFVDLQRFKPRPPLPPKPLKALVFSNYATENTYLPAVAEACRRAGIELSVIGEGAGRPVTRPEDLLGEYDLVFAKAKAAMEAMAIGIPVILCDFGGVGPMVTVENFASLREMNFGFEALTDDHSPEILLNRIMDYDPRAAAEVASLFRSCAGLDSAARELSEVYRQAIAKYQMPPPVPDGRAVIDSYATLIGYRLAYRASALWKSIPAQRRSAVLNLEGIKNLKRLTQAFLCGRRR